ncbi:MAG: hypothetical protein AB1817_15595 [Chloroflexota bacterium]
MSWSHFIKRRRGLGLIFAGLLVSALCFLFLAYVERAATRQENEYIPVSLSSNRVANYSVDPRPLQIPAARIDLIAAAIHDQEPDADAAARFAIVQANLLTPVAWLISPTPSRTPTPTRTATPTATPTFTLTPTPADPWISLGYARVSCNYEVTFATVAARKLKFQLITGGGNDNHVSFYCCGSSGAAFWVNGAWVGVTNQSSALNVGESRETGEVNAIVNRARFSVGCNDKEPVQVQIFYLPALTPTPTSATQTATRSATPSATIVPQTRTPTATSSAQSR